MSGAGYTDGKYEISCATKPRNSFITNKGVKSSQTPKLQNPFGQRWDNLNTNKNNECNCLKLIEYIEIQEPLMILQR